MTADRYLPPRDAILQAMERIYRTRMTTTSGGNVSTREVDGDVWITPARVDKGNLRRDDIIHVRADGTSQGPHPPSSELPFHQSVYRARLDLAAVVHAHPVALVAFSICRQVPDTRIFHQAHFVCGQTGFAGYALPGSQALADRIAETFRGGADCVILENHGVVVGGQTLDEAFQRFEALEFAARTILRATRLGSVRYLDDSQLAEASARTLELEPFDAEPPGVAERECRRVLCDFLRRGCRQRLLISTEGSYSARLDRDSFLITPSQRDRELLTPGDLVLVREGCAERGKRPSRATLAHQAIYREYPQVQSVLFAHPVNATAFSVTDAHLDARTIPESYLFLRDVPRVPFGLQFHGDAAITEHVSPASPAGLLENDGVVVLGKSVLDAFDRLEVLESTAEAVIDARSLGHIAAMPEAVIDELRAAFKSTDWT